jgi:hypothetical protein
MHAWLGVGARHWNMPTPAPLALGIVLQLFAVETSNQHSTTVVLQRMRLTSMAW